MIGTTQTVVVDGETITGRVYHIRGNGWPCVETATGRVASGPIATQNARLQHVAALLALAHAEMAPVEAIIRLLNQPARGPFASFADDLARWESEGGAS